MSYDELLARLDRADHEADRLHPRPAELDAWRVARRQARTDLLLDLVGAQMVDGPEGRILAWLAEQDSHTVAGVGALLEQARETGAAER